MRALQGKLRLGMIESSRVPIGDCMASRTFLLFLARSHELTAVNILVALVT